MTSTIGLDSHQLTVDCIIVSQIMLSPKGICYMILVQENKPKEIETILKEQYGLHSKVRGIA